MLLENKIYAIIKLAKKKKKKKNYEICF